MKQSIKKIAVFTAFLVVSAVILFLLYSLVSYSKQLPDGILVSSSNGMSITFEDCDSEQLKSKVSSVVPENSIVASEFSTSDFPISAKLNYTNESYSQIVPLEFMYGGYFVQNRAKEANRYAVISDTLSLKLFKEYNSIMQQIIIGEKKYIICGVYKQPHNLLHKVSSDGAEQIYLSYSNLADYEKAPIKQLYIKSEPNKLDKSLLAEIQLPHNPPVYYDSIVNFGDTKLLVKQAISMVWFLLGINIIGFFSYLFVGQSKKIYQLIQNDEQKKMIVKHGLLAFGYIVAAVLVFLFAKFDFFIPTVMLPPDDIFDITFYIDNIVKMIQAHNLLQIFNLYWGYSMLIIVSSAACSIIASGLLITAWWYAVKNVRKMWLISR